MKFRLANKNDLFGLKNMYKKIVNNMDTNGISIWDKIYPYKYFADDIENQRLYLITDYRDNMIAAFALSETTPVKMK